MASVSLNVALRPSFFSSFSSRLGSLQNRVNGVFVKAREEIAKLSLVSKERGYIFSGPFDLKVSFSWRELVMVASIGLATLSSAACFLTGALISGILFGLLTLPMCLGLFYINRWSDLRSNDQLLRTAQATSQASLQVLQEMVEINIEAYAGMSAQDSESLASWEKLRDDIQRSAGSIDQASSVMQDVAKDVRPTFGSFLEELRAILMQSEGTRSALEAQNRRLFENICELAQERGRLEGSIEGLATIRKDMRKTLEERIEIGAHLAEQVGQTRNLVDRLEAAALV